MIVFKILFFINVLLIIHTMVGYPISLKLLKKIIKNNNVKIDTTLRPSVSIIIPAHNEEKVIRRKLVNLIGLNYPKQLFEIIISSDNSTDKTNEIVKTFIEEHMDYDISLYVVRERKGKTNAQNEAVKIAKGDILVFSDANAMLHKDAVIHLVSAFINSDIIYVSGRLDYTNDLESPSSKAESSYWNYDLYMRKIESDVKTITAGNGALYAIKRSEYVDFDPIRCHDSAMPSYAALNNKRAIFNEKAIAYEKAERHPAMNLKEK